MKNTTYAELWWNAYNEKDWSKQDGLWAALKDRIGDDELFEAFNAYMYVKAEGIQAAKDFILD